MDRVPFTTTAGATSCAPVLTFTGPGGQTDAGAENKQGQPFKKSPVVKLNSEKLNEGLALT